MIPGLVIDDVSFRYGSVVVLDRQSVEVPPGKCIIVTGENGVGKSTLLYLAAGLIAVTAGTVTLDGHAPDVLHPSALFRHGVRRGFVFQQGGLVSNLSALANVTLALRYHADVLKLSPGDIEERAREVLADVDIDEQDLHSLPAHLSFGVRKRVALARALALNPNFVFFDDPDAGLDAASARIVHDILLQCRDDPRMTMLIASNHRALLDRLDVPPCELVDGRIIEGAARSIS